MWERQVDESGEDSLTLVFISVERVLASLEDVGELIVKRPVRTGGVIAEVDVRQYQFLRSR